MHVELLKYLILFNHQRNMNEEDSIADLISGAQRIQGRQRLLGKVPQNKISVWWWSNQVTVGVDGD